MDYGNPKPLPTTGAGAIIVGSIYYQALAIIAIAAVVLITALLVRYLWRRSKSIGQ